MQLLALSSSSHRQSPAPPRFSPTAATLASKCLKLLDTSSSSSSLELQLMSMASNCAPRSSLAKWQSARSEMSWPPPPAYGTRGPTGSPACCASPARCSWSACGTSRWWSCPAASSPCRCHAGGRCRRRRPPPAPCSLLARSRSSGTRSSPWRAPHCQWTCLKRKKLVRFAVLVLWWTIMVLNFWQIQNKQLKLWMHMWHVKESYESHQDTKHLANSEQNTKQNESLRN